MPVHWLSDVKPPESVALLAGLAADSGIARNGALGAIAMHDDAAADSALDRFAAAGQPEDLRRRAMGWLGSARGRHGLETLRNLLASDASTALRVRAVSAIADSKEPDALNLVIATARNDRDQQVQRRAISALGNLPAGKGVPVLIEIAQTGKSVEMRKRAMNALQQTHDPRALAFFEQVLQWVAAGHRFSSLFSWAATDAPAAMKMGGAAFATKSGGPCIGPKAAKRLRLPPHRGPSETGLHSHPNTRNSKRRFPRVGRIFESLTGWFQEARNASRVLEVPKLRCAAHVLGPGGRGVSCLTIL